MTTNGTLFYDEHIDFFQNNYFNISISLDGPKELHDMNRVFSSGKGSFDIIMENINHIKTNYPDFFQLFRFMTVITPRVDFSCITNFYDVGEFISSNVAMSLVNNYCVKEELKYDDLYYITSRFNCMKFLLAELGIYDKKKVSVLFRDALSNIERIYERLSKGKMPKKAHPSGPCLPGVMRPFVDVHGNIFPCERLPENSEAMKIGHIDKGFDMKKIHSLLNVGQLTKEECIGCWSFVFCNLCAAACGSSDELSRDERLQHCLGVKQDAINNLMTICLLLENKYKFFNNNSEVVSV